MAIQRDFGGDKWSFGVSDSAILQVVCVFKESEFRHFFLVREWIAGWLADRLESDGKKNGGGFWLLQKRLARLAHFPCSALSTGLTSNWLNV